MQSDTGCDNGELQPGDGATEGHRADGDRIQHHNRPISAPTEPEATRPDPTPPEAG